MSKRGTPLRKAGDSAGMMPRRRLNWRESDDGCCILLRPKFGNSEFGQWLASRLANPDYQIRLDQIGSFVWRACDGKTPLVSIADGMRDQFGSNIEPVEQRLATFIRQMVQSRLLDTSSPRL